MNDDLKAVLLATLFIIGIAVICYMVGVSSTTENLQQQFTKTQCAQYHPITGKFEIIKEKQ